MEKKTLNKRVVIGAVIGAVFVLSFLFVVIAQAYLPSTYLKIVGFFYPQKEVLESEKSTAKEEPNYQIIDIEDNKYRLEIEYYNTKIEEDPANPNFYTEKSEALFNLGLKEEAGNTLEEGLIYNPDNQLLKSKLDVLEKEWFNDPGQEAPRG